jgi:hypothetical protein
VLTAIVYLGTRSRGEVSAADAEGGSEPESARAREQPHNFDAVALAIFVAPFAVVTTIGFVAVRWRRARGEETIPSDYDYRISRRRTTQSNAIA